MKRHKSDVKVNESKAIIIKEDGEEEIVMWKDLRPGKIVKVKHGDEIPADLVLLVSSESQTGQAYVETSNIDGETNLKIKQSCLSSIDEAETGGYKIKENKSVAQALIDIEYEPPCGRIHTFEGTLNLKVEKDTTAVIKLPLESRNFLLRGSSLRNTKWILGLVVYSGRDTRLVRNSREAPSKLSEMERVVNNMVYFILFSMIIVSSVSTIAYVVWNLKNKKYLWYLCYHYRQDGVPKLFDENCTSGETYSNGSLWFTFFILYNNFIPISLYVTIEVINYCQAFYIDNDLRMYDTISETPALARTSNMNADLGMIGHIFSDKTGTLTQNVMRFERASVAGTVFGAPDADPPYNLAALRQQVITDAKLNRAARDFVTIMAVCHTVVPERDLNTNELIYQAESPDEEALVKGAAELGLSFIDRKAEKVIIQAAATGGDGGTNLEYEILATIPFDSTRKRMSVVCRLPDGTIRIMCKGADTIVFGLLAGSEDQASLNTHLDAFARDGLRTLVLAQRDLTSSEFKIWRKKWHDAETSTGDRSQRLAEAAAEVERDLKLVGATAIEDKLQDGVPQTIADLAKAGIKLWVLTGDKMETAINIGYSCRLLTPEMYLIKMPAEKQDGPGPKNDWGITAQLEALETLVESAFMASTGSPQSTPSGTTTTSLDTDPRRTLPKPLLDDGSTAEEDVEAPHQNDFAMSEHLGLVIEGSTAVEAILGNTELENRLLRIASACRAVVACRVSPAQKRLLVQLVKDAPKRQDSSWSFERPITLAIGDGANDVGMIQEAQIGVGISGKEGRQAVNNADFAIAQFRFLKPLLLYHGRRNYRRLSKVIIYSFEKNIVLTFVLFYFQSDCAWSGTSFYESWVYSGYNFFLGLLPFCMGFFDVDIRDVTVDRYPRLYAAGLYRMDLNVTNMVYGTIESILASLLIYYLCRDAFDRAGFAWQQHGKVSDVWVFGTTVFVSMVCAMAARAILIVNSWNAIVAICLFAQAAMLYTFILFMAQANIWLDYDFYGVAYHTFGLGTFWLVSFALVPATVATLQLLIHVIHLEFFPSLNDIGMEVDHGYVDGTHKDAIDSLPLRLRSSVHELVNKFFFGTDSIKRRASLVTRESLRQLHESMTDDQRSRVGFHHNVASSYAYDAPGTGYGAGAGSDPTFSHDPNLRPSSSTTTVL
uniref:Phospholipid-transporting ATPase n=1 Tax=Aureoumbra lagunensis TaxID=44058 RepID=A0A7S3NH53_9STRA